MAKEDKRYVFKHPKGSWIFKQGDKGETMFIIHSGKVKLTRDMAGQSENMGLLEKGDFFGEMSLLEGIPRTCSAFVEEDADVIEIDSHGFSNLLKNNVEISIRMIRKYALRLEEMNKKFETLLESKMEYDKGIREIISQIKGTDAKRTDQVEEDVAHLKSVEGNESFRVTCEPTLMGRIDPVTNIIPDIDLTKLDKGRTVSRRHARLTYVDKCLYIAEEIGVTNGTFVNGQKLTQGELKQIKEGDKIGLGKVELILEMK